MGDMGELFRDYRQHVKAKRERNLERANPQGWTQHTDHHWSRTLNGKRLDYWPSRNKFQYAGRVMCGDVEGFIRKRSKDSAAA